MYGVRERMLLRHMVEVEGRSQSEAARAIGVDRKTLRRWIAAGLLDTELDAITARYGPRPRVARRYSDQQGMGVARSSSGVISRGRLGALRVRIAQAVSSG